jgi:hypothetical protein
MKIWSSKLNAWFKKGREYIIFGGKATILPWSRTTEHKKSNKKHTTGVYFLFNWLCSVCSSRAELLGIGRRIDELKDKLGLVDLSRIY